MLYTLVKVVIAKDQLDRLKNQLDKPCLSIKIRLKGIKKGVDYKHSLLLTRAQINSINHVWSIGKQTFNTVYALFSRSPDIPL